MQKLTSILWHCPPTVWFTLPYRGLLPHQLLLYIGRGTSLSQNTKRRVFQTGEQRDYKACDSLHCHLTRLYKQAGIKGGSSHSGRRSFAGKVLAATGEMETVATLLGHADIDCSQRYVDINQENCAKCSPVCVKESEPKWGLRARHQKVPG